MFSRRAYNNGRALLSFISFMVLLFNDPRNDTPPEKRVFLRDTFKSAVRKGGVFSPSFAVFEQITSRDSR